MNPNILHKINKLITGIRSDPLWSGLTSMASGSAITQLLIIITTPILTRIYSPHDFGVAAIFGLSLSLLVIVGSLKYEVALPLILDDKKAITLFCLCFFLLIIVFFLISTALVYFNPIFLNILSLEGNNRYMLLLLPFSVLGAGSFQILNYWAIRQRDYQSLSLIKVKQTITGASVKIIIGIFLIGPFGLIIGDITGQIAGIGSLVKNYHQSIRFFYCQKLLELKQVAIEYKKFPIFTLPATFFNTLSQQVPILLLTLFYGASITGQYSLSYGVIVLPGSIIAGSMGQVFLGEISKKIRDKDLCILDFYYNTTRRMIFIALPLYLGLAIVSPFIIPMVFGEKWVMAGIFCVPLAIMNCFAFVVSSTGNLNVFGYNNWQLWFDVSRTIMTTLVISISFMLVKSPMINLFGFVIVMAVFYLIYYFLNIRAIKKFYIIE